MLSRRTRLFYFLIFGRDMKDLCSSVLLNTSSWLKNRLFLYNLGNIFQNHLKIADKKSVNAKRSILDKSTAFVFLLAGVATEILYVILYVIVGHFE